jgi:hypothetical protein
MKDRVKKDSRPDELPKLVAAGMDSRAYTAREAWQLLAIMSEFVAATERLNQVRPAVSIFGSDRFVPSPAARETFPNLWRRAREAETDLLHSAGPPGFH